MLSTLCISVFSCMLTTSQAIAYPNQTGHEYLRRMVKTFFGDIHIRRGMSVKSTQTIDSSVKSTEVQAFKVHFTLSLACCRCVWMWLCVIEMKFAVCLVQMPPSWRQFKRVKVENPTHLAFWRGVKFIKRWHHAWSTIKRSSGFVVALWRPAPCL